MTNRVYWTGEDGGPPGSTGPAAGLPRPEVGAFDSGRFEIARDWLIAGGSVLIYGQARAGKSTLLDSVVAAAQPPRILRCTPPRAGSDLPFFGLADLLSGLSEAELGLLPPAQQRILTSVLRRVATPSGDASPVAVPLAALRTLRILAEATPVLLVVDDLQWLDHATAEVLRFVASRVVDLPIWLAAAERSPRDRPPVGRALCPAPLLMVGMDPAAPADPGA
jgi:hypothetical protein